MPKKKIIPVNDMENPDIPVSFTPETPENEVNLVYYFTGSEAIVKGKSGRTYTFRNGEPVSVLVSDATELLVKTKTYRPCCSGQEKIINLFTIV
jgi:hypothetical protein